jgi:cell division protein FtsB
MPVDRCWGAEPSNEPLTAPARRWRVARLAPTTRVRRRSALGGLSMLLVMAALLGYFGFHAFNGDFGIWAMDRLQAEGERLRDDLAELKAERDALAAPVLK